jgi:hypothetical protein
MVNLRNWTEMAQIWLQCWPFGHDNKTYVCIATGSDSIVITSLPVAFGGLVVIVLAIGPKADLNPAQDDGF